MMQQNSRFSTTFYGRIQAVLRSPPCSPCLGTSNFRSLGGVTDAIRGSKFETNDDVIRAVKT